MKALETMVPIILTIHILIAAALVVVVLLPIEVATGYLYYLTKAMLPETVGDGEKWEGPIKQIVSPLSR